MNYLDLFSGIGGFHLGILQAGIKIDKCYFSEIDPFAIRLYQKRFPAAIPLGDIKNIKGAELGTIDFITGGFPCQPFSCAGKRRGTQDNRYLWPETIRIIRETKPTWCLLENVRGLLTINEGLVFEQVCLDLEREGYEVQSFIIPACAVNAPHRRDRVWFLAYSGDSKYRRWGGQIRETESIQGEHRQALCSGRISGAGKTASDTIGNGHKERHQESTGQIRSGEQGGMRQSKGKNRLFAYANHRRSQRQEQQATGNKQCNSIATNSESRKSWEQAEQEGREDTCGRNKKSVTDAEGTGQPGSLNGPRKIEFWGSGAGANWFEVATLLCGVDDGVSTRMDGFELSKPRHRVERLKALGNSVVVPLVAEIFRMIKEVDYQ